ncbi:MAG: SCO family protein [Polyangiaceae bacterium]|nr:SCO family protein [Polyangiaceae bacterium]
MKWLFTGACLLSMLVACKAKEEGQAPASEPASVAAQVPAQVPQGAEAAAHETLGAGQGAVDASLYDLELKLTDQHGKAIALDEFRGHPVVISMFYATCPFACPTLIRDIKRFERSLDEASRAKLRVLLVSIDPERDTPQVLMELAERHQLDSKRYRLATAPDSDVRALAAALGFKYRKLEGGAFNHSSLITLLDARGFPQARVDGLNQPLEALTARVRAMP